MKVPRDSVQVRRAARAAFQNDARNWVDTLRIGRLTSAEILTLVRVEGWDNLEHAAARGQGVVLVSLHLGNFDLVGQALAARGYHVTIPVERIHPPELLNFLVDQRSSQGITLVPIEQAARQMVRALRRGEIAAITGDRNVAGRTARVPMFDAEADLPLGPASLARHTGAPVLVGVGLREGFNRYRGILTAEIPLSSAVRDADAEIEDTRSITAVLEEFISLHPEQWLAFSPVWSYVGSQNPTVTMDQHSKVVT
jgi:lauroyl/myristoyl acyltransferase